MKDRRNMPIRIEAETADDSETKTNGRSSANDARDEVDEVTSPESRALRCTFARRL
jgi:hypothetical protein